MSDVAMVFARRVRAGLMALEDVPAPWRAQAAELLEDG